MAGTSSRASPTSRQPRRCSCVTSSRTRTSTRSTSRSSGRTWTQARAAAPPPGPVDLGDGDHPDHGCPAGMSLDTLGIVALEILNSITILALLVVGALGIAIERLIIRRLYGRPLDVMLATWGVSLLLIGLITVIFGAVTQGIPFALGNFQVGRYSYPEYRIVMTSVAASLMLGVYLLFRYTSFGRRARATIANPQMASAAGINTPRMFMLTFGLGAGLAGAAGAIMAPIVGVVPTMGVLYIARAFITVVVGGPVVLVGTLSSASALGFIEALISR